MSGLGYGSLMLRMVVESDSVATSAKIQEKEREKKIGSAYTTYGWEI